MSIDIADLVSEVRSDLDEQDPKFWQNADIINALNRALRHAYKFWYRASEFTFLEEESITIDQTAVDNETKTFTLPARTQYVSSWHRLYPNWGVEVDKRPYFIPDSNTDVETHYALVAHYQIHGNTIVFNTPFAETGTLKLWVKKLPARITSLSGTISLPEFLMDSLVQATIFFAYRKDDVDAGFHNTEKKMLNDQLVDDLDILRNMHGTPTQIGGGIEIPNSGDL